MSKNLKVKAFTLLETLVALLVLSGGILVFQAMTQLLSSELHQQENNQQQEWLLFADQLETELSRSQFDKVEDNKIYIRQDGRDLALGKSKGDDFRKTDKNSQVSTGCLSSGDTFTMGGRTRRDFLFHIPRLGDNTAAQPDNT